MKAERSVYRWVGVALLVAVVAAPAQMANLQTVRVISLGTPLSVVIGETHGTFAKYGIQVLSGAAPNSDVLRDGLASGRADVAHAAVDNAVAMVELAGADVIIVLGGEGTMNELIAQPEVKSVRDLRGRTVIVDAPNTAFALQLKKILLLNGIEPGRDCEIKPVGATPQRLVAMREHKEYAASILGPPTSLLAKRAGFVSLGSARQLIGPYQGPGAFVRRQWAREHADALVGYIAATVEVQRWLVAPAHKHQVLELMTRNARLPADVAAETFERSLTDPGGYAKDLRFDVEGFKNVLKLRAEVEGQWGGRPPAPEKYYDLTYYQAAISKLKAGQ